MVRFGWFDVPIGGNVEKYTYSADQMRDLWRSIYTNGIIPEVRQTDHSQIVPQTQLGNSLAAIVGQGLNLRINLGIAMIDGAYFIIDEEPINIPLTAGQVNDIVLRLDLTGTDVVFGIFAKPRATGTLEAGLTRSGGIYELGLHSVNVPDGADQIAANMITDYRLNLNEGPDGKPCCGLVGSLLQPDIDAWYQRARSELAELLEKNEADLTEWLDQSKESFDTWFSTLQDTLSGDVAGNLYNLITNHTNNEQVHVSSADRARWDAAGGTVYTLPLPAASWQKTQGEIYQQAITLPNSNAQTKVDLQIDVLQSMQVAAPIQVVNDSGTLYAQTIAPPSVDLSVQATVTTVQEG